MECKTVTTAEEARQLTAQAASVVNLEPIKDILAAITEAARENSSSVGWYFYKGDGQKLRLLTTACGFSVDKSEADLNKIGDSFNCIRVTI